MVCDTAVHFTGILS